MIGKKLLEHIGSCSDFWGKCNGFHSERLLGIYSISSENMEERICLASSIIQKNRLFKSFKESICNWVKVKKGFYNLIENNPYDIAQLESYLPSTLFAQILQRSRSLLLVLESDKNPYLVIIFNTETHFIFLEEELMFLEETPSPFKRIEGIVPLEELSKNSVAIIGLGSGGSFIALELAAAGVGELVLVDRDRLNPENIIRHICGENDLGRNKVEAVKSTISDHMLPTKVKTHTFDIISNFTDIIEIVKEVDLVICATDNVKSRESVNYLCSLLGKESILVCTFDNARIGEIIRVKPKILACYQCIRLHLKDSQSMESLEDDAADVIPYSSQLITNGKNRGTRTDIFMTSSLAVKMALSTLNDSFGEIPYNYLTWSSYKNTIFNHPFAFNNHFVTNFMTWSIHPNCPICGDTPTELIGINIQEKYDEIIKSISTP